MLRIKTGFERFGNDAATVLQRPFVSNYPLLCNLIGWWCQRSCSRSCKLLVSVLAYSAVAGDVTPKKRSTDANNVLRVVDQLRRDCWLR